jgi:hypothetical protein
LSEYIFLPLISFVSGFASLYIDPKTDKARAWIVVSVLFASALFTGIYGYEDGKTHDGEVKTARTDAAAVRKSTDDQLELAKNALDIEKSDYETIKQLNASVAALVSRAHLPETEGDKQSVSRQVPSANLPIIEYFAKAADGDAITKAARALGYGVVTMPGQHSGPTNAVWVGDDIPLADTKSISLALTQHGVQLRAVRLFRDGKGPKSRLIEIGRDEALANASILTADQIQNLKSLSPRSAAAQ